MTLEHLRSPAQAVREICRILKQAGRVIVVEPDNLCDLFYFDAYLEELNSAFRELLERLNSEQLPLDCAIGPTEAKLLECEQLTVTEFFPYVVGSAKKQAAKESFDRARLVVRIVSANLPRMTSKSKPAISRSTDS